MVPALLDTHRVCAARRAARVRGMWMGKVITLLNADARQIPLADGTVQCVITSPPYYGLRDYGIAGQIGLEPTPEEYVSNIVAVMRECWRVLRDDGTLWLNLGDSYNGSGKGPAGISSKIGNVVQNAQALNARTDVNDLKPKDLLGIPWRVAFALQADGWYLRSDIIWHKPNPMPESVTDRPTKAHEYIFLLSKSERYYYDAAAIKEQAQESSLARQRRGVSDCHKNINGAPGQPPHTMNQPRENDKTRDTINNRNCRSVWTVATVPYGGAHFATFPPKLVEPMVLAGSRCGSLVLDPFAGTATVGRVCAQHGRDFVGLDLSLAYIELAQERTSKVQISMELCGNA